MKRKLLRPGFELVSASLFPATITIKQRARQWEILDCLYHKLITQYGILSENQTHKSGSFNITLNEAPQLETWSALQNIFLKVFPSHANRFCWRVLKNLINCVHPHKK